MTSKCSKSPRTLRKIRVKAKERRECRSIAKNEEEKSKILVRQNETENENYAGTIPKSPAKTEVRSVDTRMELKIKNVDPVFKDTSGSGKEKTKPSKSSLSSLNKIRGRTDSKMISKSTTLTEVIRYSYTEFT